MTAIADIYLTTHDIANCLDVCETHIRRWYRSGIMPTKHARKNRPWNISGIDFAKFLCYNPRYREIFEKTENLSKRLKEDRRIILLYLYENYQKLYTPKQLAKILYVTERVPRHWAYKGYLKITESPHSISRYLIDPKDFLRFLASHPRYQKMYGEFITENFVNWDLSILDIL